MILCLNSSLWAGLWLFVTFVSFCSREIDVLPFKSLIRRNEENGKSHHLVRRRQSFEDLIRGESIPKIG
jgi:hypothetical protein